jgi:hypothetical protein
MAQIVIYGISTLVVSIGVMLYARLRQPAYAAIRRESRERLRVR